MTKEAAKSAVQRTIEDNRDAIIALGEAIYRTPETGFREQKTAAQIVQALDEHGVTFTQLGDIPGIKATFDTGRPGPGVAIIGEMDAIICADHPDSDPQTGAVHACGHNAQIAAAFGAFIGLLESDALAALSGKVHFMAVPAEEYIEVEYRQNLRQQGTIRYLGGKPELMYRGFFDDVDLTMMLHTFPHEKRLSLNATANGCLVKQFRFIGKAAHAGGAPDKGINALYAANLGLMAINALRETFRDEDHIRVHPIITRGGAIVNVIPSDVRAETFVRGATTEAITAANRAVDRALIGSAAALGASIELNDLAGYLPLKVSPLFNALAGRVMHELVPAEEIMTEPTHLTGSTDMGDLSTVMPVIQPYIGGVTGVGHGADFQVTDPDTAYVLGAHFLARAAVELLAENAEEARSIIDAYKPQFADKHAYFAYADKLFSYRRFTPEDLGI